MRLICMSAEGAEGRNSRAQWSTVVSVLKLSEVSRASQSPCHQSPPSAWERKFSTKPKHLQPNTPLRADQLLLRLLHTNLSPRDAGSRPRVTWRYAYDGALTPDAQEFPPFLYLSPSQPYCQPSIRINFLNLCSTRGWRSLTILIYNESTCHTSWKI